MQAARRGTALCSEFCRVLIRRGNTNNKSYAIHKIFGIILKLRQVIDT